MSAFLVIGLVLTILPAGFVLLAAGRSIPAEGADGQRRHSRVLVLLACAAALAIPFGLFSLSLFTDWGSLLALLFLPALVGVLAVLILQWRPVASLLVTGRRSERLLASALLVLLSIFLIMTTRSQPAFMPLLLAGTSIAAGSWLALRRLQGGALIAAGLTSCLLLLADASGLASPPALYDSQALRTIYKLGSAFVPFLALGCAVLLVHAAFSAEPKGGLTAERRRLPGRVASLLTAGLILLSIGAAVYRSGLMVNATGHAYEDHLPYLLVLASVVAGLLLALTSRTRRGTLTGLAFTGVVCIAILLAYWLGWQVDPHAVTARRAHAITWALMEYRQDHGAYPSDLAALTPGYLPVLLGPLNGRAQRWCYQGLGGSYRLAYVFYQRYWDPDQFYKIEMISTDGKPLEGTWMCDAELNRMKNTGGL